MRAWRRSANYSVKIDLEGGALASKTVSLHGMNGTLMTQERLMRVAIFVIVLLGMVIWETVGARRPQRIDRWQRWPSNLLIVFLDTLAIRLVFPLAAVGAALIAAAQGWGLFNLVRVPAWLAILASVVVLDLALYFLHRVFHAVPWLWRLHRMHHTDREFDVTTGLRFHPLEILISMGIKLAAVTLIGAPALAVLIFEVLLNATSMLNHGNVSLPIKLDRWLRLAEVTPDMHRVHHSIVRKETDSNLGLNLPW